MTESPSLASTALVFMRQMVALNRSVDILHAEEEILSLFCATLVDLMGDVGVVLQLHRDGAAPSTFVRPFGGELHPAPTTPRLAATEDEVLQEDALLLTDAVRGCRFRLDATGEPMGLLQIEVRDELKLTLAEREMLLLFAQHLCMALARHAASMSKRDVSSSHLLLNEIDALVLICDPERRIRAANRAFRRTVARDASGDLQVIGQDVLGFTTREDRQVLTNAAARVMASKSGQTIRVRLGEEPYTMHLSHLGTPGGVTGFSAVCYRAPELSAPAESPTAALPRELEHRLGESQRLIALGRLATGLAHELKSPMTTILSYADYLLSKYRGSLFETRDSERLERIITDVERMDQSVRDLITFAQVDKDSAELIGLHELMRDAVAMSGPIMHARSIVYDLRLDDDRIVARPGHVRHIFINLLRNAAFAMEGNPSGALTLRTYGEGDQVIAEVIDEGCGIPEHERERIFEPFFSTRKGRGGSGIGLSIVQMLASRQRAQVHVSSEVGVGSCFQLSFPRPDSN